MFSEVVISIGSNCGYDNVSAACGWLLSILDSAESSCLYETPAVNGGSHRYVNAVVKGKTDMGFDRLNEMFKQYEVSAGRDEACREKGIVPVDIDIVLFSGKVIREWDFRQTFFKIGYSEFSGSVIER